jgi:hypothetical protein
MAELHKSERHVYRRNAHRITIALLWLVPAAFFALLAAAVQPAFALGCIPWLLLAYRTYRIGVFTSPDDVLVRNVMRSRRIAWSVVERFDWGTWSGFPIGGVYLHDGHFVRAFALNPPFDVKQGADKTVRRALAGLNEELERARAAGTTSAEPLPEAPATGKQQLSLDN